jgi:hypothetical protein
VVFGGYRLVAGQATGIASPTAGPFRQPEQVAAAESWRPCPASAHEHLKPTAATTGMASALPAVERRGAGPEALALPGLPVGSA